MCAEARDVGMRSKNGKDGEENLLANGVPKLRWERLTMLLQRFKEIIQCSAVVSVWHQQTRSIIEQNIELVTHLFRTSRSSPFMITS